MAISVWTKKIAIMLDVAVKNVKVKVERLKSWKIKKLNVNVKVQTLSH